MPSENMEEQTMKKDPKCPPPFISVTLRRETYTELLRASEFLTDVWDEDASVSDAVDELLVSFNIARLEASGGDQHA
jgi:hypothetical protein